MDGRSLPTVDDVLRTLPDGFRSGLVVTVEACDGERARLALSVQAGTPLDLALFGAAGWTRVCDAFRSTKRPLGRVNRPSQHTYWCWVLPGGASDVAALRAVPGPNRP